MLYSFKTSAREVKEKFPGPFIFQQNCHPDCCVKVAEINSASPDLTENRRKPCFMRHNVNGKMQRVTLSTVFPPVIHHQEL